MDPLTARLFYFQPWENLSHFGRYGCQYLHVNCHAQNATPMPIILMLSRRLLFHASLLQKDHKAYRTEWPWTTMRITPFHHLTLMKQMKEEAQFQYRQKLALVRSHFHSLGCFAMPIRWIGSSWPWEPSVHHPRHSIPSWISPSWEGARCLRNQYKWSRRHGPCLV